MVSHQDGRLIGELTFPSYFKPHDEMNPTNEALESAVDPFSFGYLRGISNAKPGQTNNQMCNGAQRQDKEKTNLRDARRVAWRRISHEGTQSRRWTRDEMSEPRRCGLLIWHECARNGPDHFFRRRDRDAQAIARHWVVP